MTTYSFDFTAAARSNGLFTAPPSWLSIACSTTGRTVQASAARVASGLGANAWRARYVGAPGTFPGLSVESSRTNVHLRASGGPTGWTTFGGATLIPAYGPDGVQGNGLEIAWPNSNNAYAYAPAILANTLPGILSVWFKGVHTSTVEVLDAQAAAYDNKVSTTSSWTRYSLLLAADAAQTLPAYGRGTIQVTSGDVLMWGQMVELGALYPSSVIATGAASVTRNADVLSGSATTLFPGGTVACTMQIAPNFAQAVSTVAAGSNTVVLATFGGAGVLQATSTAGFPSVGKIVFPNHGGAVVSYTGTTATSFTGCNLVSGAGTLATNDPIRFSEATSDVPLLWLDASNQVFLRNSDATVCVMVGGVVLLVSSPVAWLREQPITIAFVDTAQVGLQLTVSGTSSGSGQVRGAYTPMSTPATAYFLGSSSGATECVDLQKLTVNIATRLELINQDPEPNDPEAALNYLNLAVIDGGSAGPDPNSTDIRVFRAQAISSAAASSDGTRTILTFASPHLLNPTAITTENISAAPLSTSPTAVTTSAPHGLVTGQFVNIAGVLGNTAVNGTWPITRTGASSFTIPVAGNAAYLGGGTVTGPVGQVVPVIVDNVVGLGAGLNATWNATVLSATTISVPFVPLVGSAYVAGGSVTPAPLPIASVTASLVNPVVLTFASPHGLGPVGATISAYVSDVAQNAAANGDFTATIASPTTVTLPLAGTSGAPGGATTGTMMVGLMSTLAYHAGAIQAGWSGSVGLMPLDSGTLNVALVPSTPFISDAAHWVRVLANDIGVTIPPLVTLYEFRTKDVLPPAVLGAVAPDRMTVQVAFYEPVSQSYTNWAPNTRYLVGQYVVTPVGAFFQAISATGDGLSAPTVPGPTGTTTFVDNQVTWAYRSAAPSTFASDALNPANYALSVLAGLPAVGTVAGNPKTVGSLTVASVKPGYATNVVVLTLNIAMTRGATYQVAVSNVVDPFGNAVAAPTNTATFLGWQLVVPGRDFNLYKMWPETNRLDDVTLDMQNILGACQEVVDLIFSETDQFLDIMDPDIAPPAWLPSLLADQGNPFGTILGQLSPDDQRRLIHALVPIYRLKGTDPGIVEALNFFLGITATVTYEALGGPPLGSAYLGPPPSTSVAFASDGLVLSTLTGSGTVVLDSTLGFSPAGVVFFPDLGNAEVSYTGLSGTTTLTGCTLISGSGTLAVGNTATLLGGGPLGGELILGAPPGIERLTFFVNVPAGLTPQQTANGKQIVAYMKRAGTRPVWRPPQPFPPAPPPTLGSFVLGPGGTWVLV